MADPKRGIKSVDIRFEGFTFEELKDIIGYIRSVEAHKPTRLVFVMLDTPDLTPEEAQKHIEELWPDETPPPFFTFIPRSRRR